MTTRHLVLGGPADLTGRGDRLVNDSRIELGLFDLLSDLAEPVPQLLACSTIRLALKPWAVLEYTEHFEGRPDVSHGLVHLGLVLLLLEIQVPLGRTGVRKT